MTQGSSDDGKRIGRPLKNPEQGKRSNVMFRLGEVRKNQLMQAAEAAGRSMSEEIEARLEASFKEPEIIYKTSEQAIAQVVDVLNNKTTEKFGGVDGQYAGEEFGKAFSGSIKDVEALIGGPPWHQNDIKIEEVRQRMRRAPDIIVGMVLDRIRLQNETPEEIAQRLGLDVAGLSRDEAVAALWRHFEGQAKSRSGSASPSNTME